jgi:hypothetical protein
MIRRQITRWALAAALLLAPLSPTLAAGGTSAWVAGNGQGLTYGTSGFTLTDFNSLASGSVVVASSAITQTTALDLYADVSFVLTVGGTTTATSYMTLYILPLNQDGTTYGDGVANGSTLPVATYQASTVGVKSGVTSGNTITGTFRGVVLPPGNWKFAVSNNLGVALNATAAAAMSYRTYNENLNR